MTIVYFIRHAEPDFNIHDDMERPLTEEGRKSCSKVTRYLLDKNITRIFSSPYKRAVDTVSDFAHATGLKVEAIYDLRERTVNDGWIENFSAFVHNQWKDFNYKLKGGESLHEVQARCIPALESILKEVTEGNIVIGSHGTAISTIIHYYDNSYGVEHFNRIRNRMPFVARLTFDHTVCRSIQILDILGGEEVKLYEKTI